jgi:hypothetical protein
VRNEDVEFRDAGMMGAVREMSRGTALARGVPQEEMCRKEHGRGEQSLLNYLVKYIERGRRKSSKKMHG